MLLFNEIMAMVLPSFCGLLLYMKISKKTLSVVGIITHFSLFSLFTNCVMYGIVIYFFNNNTFVFTNMFTLKYSLLAFLIACGFAIFFRVIELNVKIKLEVKKNDEE